MSKSYKNKLSPIKEPIEVTIEKLNPIQILKKKPRYIPGYQYPVRDGHNKKTKLPVSRRSRKRRRRNNKKKTKRNFAGCACSNYGNCDCRRRARIEMEARQRKKERDRLIRLENQRKADEKTLKKAKRLKLKDKKGNHFTMKTVREAEEAIQSHMEFQSSVKNLFLPTAKVTQPTGIVEGIPIPTTRWQKIKNFIKRKTRKVHPVSIVPESGKRKTRRKKRRKMKKKKRKSKKNLAGSTCNRFANDCHGCLAFRVESSNIPWHRALGVRPGNDKTCLFNLDTGACRQPNIAAGRSHGRNDWTRNVDHCTVDAVEEAVNVEEIMEPELVRQTTDEGTPFAYPIGTTEEGDNLPTAQVESPRRTQGVCDSVTENCAIMGGKNSRKKKRKNKKTKKKRRRRR